MAALLALILGALGTIIALWQVVQWHLGRRTRLEVTISEPANKSGNRALLTVRNRGDRNVTVVTAGFELPLAPRTPGKPPMVYQLHGDGGSFDPVEATYPPQTLASDGAWTTVIYRDVIEGKLGRPPTVTAFACAANRKCFKSRPTVLWGPHWKQQIAEIEEAERRNRQGPLG